MGAQKTHLNTTSLIDRNLEEGYPFKTPMFANSFMGIYGLAGYWDWGRLVRTSAGVYETRIPNPKPETLNSQNPTSHKP